MNKSEKAICICLIVIGVMILNLSLNLSSSVSDLTNKIEDTSVATDKSSLVKFESIEEASSYLGIHKESLNKLLLDKNSKIPYLKIKGKYIFYRDALDEWIKNLSFVIE
ncbi:helix-turn-helix domain-containing protein [Clostridioides difficile]|nr:helix-turn-helix domain-containing protein [Clostridioides difficile]